MVFSQGLLSHVLPNSSHGTPGRVSAWPSVCECVLYIYHGAGSKPQPDGSILCVSMHLDQESVCLCTPVLPILSPIRSVIPGLSACLGQLLILCQRDRAPHHDHAHMHTHTPILCTMSPATAFFNKIMMTKHRYYYQITIILCGNRVSNKCSQNSHAVKK